MVAGGMSGVSLWAAIYPTDVIKSRSQVTSPFLFKIEMLDEKSYF